jgi:maltose alpha-D-glucosyltransferase/alpha-amylase
MIDDLWYKNSVIYCLSVGTYMDANGDGIGDFKGLLRRLDYLHGLGITTIWLMPFQPSPGKDDGYDISDYYGVDPRYGTLGDFVEFTHGCKQRGLRVIIDLVVNHTSNEHAWFKSARSAKDSPQNTTCCGLFANSCNGARATPSSWPKPMCCPRPTWNISAAMAAACT